MKKVLLHPFRSIGAALTIVGAAVVLVVLVLPAMAAGGRPSGKNAIWYYVNNKGNVINHIQGDPNGFENELGVVGKNLNHTSTVYCWSGAGKTWVPVSDQTIIDSRLVVVDPNNDCIGTNMPIRITFTNGSPSPAYGPNVMIQ